MTTKDLAIAIKAQAATIAMLDAMVRDLKARLDKLDKQN